MRRKDLEKTKFLDDVFVEELAKDLVKGLDKKEIRVQEIKEKEYLFCSWCQRVFDKVSFELIEGLKNVSIDSDDGISFDIRIRYLSKDDIVKITKTVKKIQKEKRR
jgi:hypothetical protein